MKKKTKIVIERSYIGEEAMETVFKDIYAKNMRDAVREQILHKKGENQQALPEKTE